MSSAVRRGSRAPWARAATAGAAAALALAVWPDGAGDADAKEPPATYEYGCRVQPPQKFLERRSFMKGRSVDAGKHLKALKYLATHYGNAGDATTPGWNGDGAASHAKTVSFFGLHISVHEKVAPALTCVEKRIRDNCHGRSGYTPRAIGGFRSSNTYRGPEVSNHLFGIALDIDPDRNPCCGCVDPWPTSPLCQQQVKSAYERTAMPKCWIKSFERYGFDWLGHDTLEDTMHFEFLGDPDEIKKPKKKK